MFDLGTSLANLLIGSIDSTEPVELIEARFASLGGDPHRLVVLRGQRGLDALYGPPTGGSAMSRWLRRLYRATDDTAEHILSSAAADLAEGRTVVVLRHVERADAATAAARLRELGVGRLHHAGRWTSNDHGLIPAAAEPGRQAERDVMTDAA